MEEIQYIGDYRVLGKIGEGSFDRKVFRAQHLYNGIVVAIKVVEVTSDIELKSLQDEIKYLIILGRDNLWNGVQYFTHFNFEDNGRNYIAIAMEDLSGWSNLGGFMMHKHDTDPYRMIDSFDMQILIGNLLNGLKYIHMHNIAHKDIKPENIMIDQNFNVKYIDFVLSCDDHDTCSIIAGSTPYYSPESYTYTYSEGKMSFLNFQQKHDIWSLGVVIYQLCNIQRYPFNYPFDVDPHADNPDLLMQETLTVAPFKYDSKYKYEYGYNGIDFNSFIYELLQYDYLQRPDIDTLITKFNKLIRS